jgi:serine protease
MTMRLLRQLAPLITALALAVGSLGLGAAERGPVVRVMTANPVPQDGRVIVKFREGASLLRSQAQSQGKTVSALNHAVALGARSGLSLSDGRTLDARTQVMRGVGISSVALASTLARDADVEWAVPDQRRFAADVPNDPLYADAQTSTTPVVGQWYLRSNTGGVMSALDVEPAWAITTGKSSVVVAVLDSGVRPEHPDLAGKLLAGYDFVGWSGSASVAAANDGDLADSDPADPGDWITSAEDASGEFAGCGVENSSWHGTQVSGLIGAASNNGVGMAGVGRGVMLLPVRVLGKCGGYDSDIIAGMRWAAGFAVNNVPTNPNPARVLNLSLGSDGACSSAYRAVVTELTAAKVLVVAAAGNDGLAVGTPANCSGVVAVAGVRHTGTKVGYSNLGPEVTVSAPAGNCVNVNGACLYPLLSTTNSGTTGPVSASYTDSYNAGLGTSFSTPLVAGTAALMLSADSSLSNAELISLLKSTARSFPSTGADSGVGTCRAPSQVAQDSECYCSTSTCGAGLLDAGRAVAAAAVLHQAAAHISATASQVNVGSGLVLDGSTSTGAAGASIVGYQWSLTAGSDFAAFSGSTSASSATLVGTAAGTATVKLVVTDSTGSTANTSVSIAVLAVTPAPNPTPTSSGGGGALAPLWALGLLVLAAALRPRRR